ncbi:MAG: PIN domain-containing protein [Gammaproteobacteria bacterium]
MQDDELQARLASYLIETNAYRKSCLYQCITCEIVWVFKRAYRYDKAVILTILKQLLSISEVCISSQPSAWAAYSDYETGNADFSDYFIARINKNAECPYTFTFDKKACQNGNFKLLSV